jgi:hypothetical protein
MIRKTVLTGHWHKVISALPLWESGTVRCSMPQVAVHVVRIVASSVLVSLATVGAADHFPQVATSGASGGKQPNGCQCLRLDGVQGLSHNTVSRFCRVLRHIIEHGADCSLWRVGQPASCFFLKAHPGMLFAVIADMASSISCAVALRAKHSHAS